MSAKIKICKETGCVSVQTTSGFCRLHYLKNWKDLQVLKKEKSERKLKNYIDHILRRDPDKTTVSNRKTLAFGMEAEDVQPSNPLYNRDEFDDVLENLGYREDLGTLIDNLKVDEDF